MEPRFPHHLKKTLLSLLLGGAGLDLPGELPGQCPQLVWSDEFEGNALNQAQWELQVGDGCPSLCGWGNSELQYYRAENTVVSQGTLKITARKEAVHNRRYTSARLRSLNRGDWTYGRFEARIKLPSGQGLWPAAEVTRIRSHSGSYAARITQRPLVQLVDGLRPATSYQLTAWLAVPGGQATLGVDGHGGTVRGPAVSASEFTPSSLTFTTGPHHTGARIWVETTRRPAGRGWQARRITAYADDFELIEAP